MLKLKLKNTKKENLKRKIKGIHSIQIETRVAKRKLEAALVEKDLCLD